MTLAKDKQLTSIIGEYFVLYQMARYGLFGSKLSDRHDYDLLFVNGARVEVKAATPSFFTGAWVKRDGTKSRWSRWQFNNHVTLAEKTKDIDGRSALRYKLLKRNRQCDFFALICLDNNKEVVRSYIVPTEYLTKSASIVISESGKCMYDNYLEEWDLLLNFGVGVKIAADTGELNPGRKAKYSEEDYKI